MQEQALPFLTIGGIEEPTQECAQVCSILSANNDSDTIAQQIISDAHNRFGFGDVIALLDRIAA